MTIYNIRYSDEALLDLESIEKYNFFEFKNPDTAFNFTNGILETVAKLRFSPYEHPIIDDKYLHTLEFRLTYFNH